MPNKYRTLWLIRDGYQPRLIELGKTSNPWVCLNILNLGVGLMVDVGSGMDRAPDTTAAHVALRHREANQTTPTWRRLGERATAPTSAAPRQHDLAGLGAIVGLGLRTVATHHR
ncbi:MAG: hypothetical protein ACI9S9_003650 [Planctomycetota bacterium]|jgi:hypothetical protein